MSTPSKIRVGIIGAGGIVRQRHLPGLQAIPGVEIAVVCNQRLENAEKFARDFTIPEVAKEWTDVVSRTDLDVIWIGTTPNLHAPIAIAALEHGKHVFCQARMAMNLAEARLMLAAAQAHPRQTNMLCPPPNGMKHGRHFLKLLREGTIGQPFHFHLRSHNAAWADPTAPPHWRQKTEVSGNNIMSVGIYGEVLGAWLGQPESLCAQARVCIPNRAGYAVKVPDIVQILGQWPNDLRGTLEWSGVAQGKATDRLQIYGAKGALAYDFGTDEILLTEFGKPDPISVEIPPEYVGKWQVEADFIHGVRTGTQPEPSFQTGVHYMRFVEAVNHSIRDRRWVALASL